MKVLNVQNVPGCFNIAIVVSRFNQDITQKLHDGALQRLKELGFPDDRITVAWVPGAVEIPITAKRFALTGEYEAIICLGAVIYGETKHFEYVCQQVTHGCQTVALSHDIPVIFGVLTTDNMAQAQDRVGGKKGHMGIEAANAAYEMVSVLSQI
jgi:6,7-dimethyl-8-ribityllumazine synthase